MKKLLCIFLSISILSSPVVAQEAVMKSVLQGEPVPFDGTLLNQPAVAEMLIKLNKTEEICKLKLKEERDIQKANCNLAIDKLKIANDFEISVYKSQNDFLRKQIDLSVKHLEKKSVATEWWFVGGFVLGALTALGSGYIASKIVD